MFWLGFIAGTVVGANFGIILMAMIKVGGGNR